MFVNGLKAAIKSRNSLELAIPLSFSNLPWMSLEFLGDRTLRNIVSESGSMAANWQAVYVKFVGTN